MTHSKKRSIEGLRTRRIPGKSWQRPAALTAAALASCEMDTVYGEGGHVHWVITVHRSKAIHKVKHVQEY